MSEAVDIIELHRQRCAPGVWDADAAELDAAGWGEVKDRTKIPANWRESGPNAKQSRPRKVHGKRGKRVSPTRGKRLALIRERLAK